MIIAECPSCGAEIRVGSRPTMGQQLVCRDCQTLLKVSWLSPLELDWADEEYEEDDELESALSRSKRINQDRKNKEKRRD